MGFCAKNPPLRQHSTVTSNLPAMNNKSFTQDELEFKIDIAFKNKFLVPKEKELTDFFSNLINCKYDFRSDNKPCEISVIDVFYYAICPVSFLFAEPNSDIYNSLKTVYIPEIHLKDYSFFDVEEVVREILDENSIDYINYLNNDFLDIAFFWENQYELEMKFIIQCWKSAKMNTNSKIIGILQSSDASGYIYNLDNGIRIEEIEIEKYLREIGCIIEKEH